MARAASYDRERALDAAMNLFWAKGYNATSLKDLESALSMRPGSIYAAFRSKDDLFRATLDRYAERSAEEMRAIVGNSPSPLGALRTHLLSIGQPEPVDRPSTACMMVKSLLELPSEGGTRDLVISHLDRVEGLLRHLFANAIAKGELPAHADPDRLARRMQTYIFGLKIQAQRETDPRCLQELCRDLADEIGRCGGDPAEEVR